ncbi:hypothetical protein ACJRO7_036012 [Eucalyptus globulus]|uniref:Uncharacterized protein n=1 Tax=Eucalyptus globulus TaxID=34317 RepID=A0ABD3JB45_EUCGL
MAKDEEKEATVRRLLPEMNVTPVKGFELHHQYNTSLSSFQMAWKLKSLTSPK